MSGMIDVRDIVDSALGVLKATDGGGACSTSGPRAGCGIRTW
jgi:hypothetical protein